MTPGRGYGDPSPRNAGGVRKYREPYGMDDSGYDSGDPRRSMPGGSYGDPNVNVHNINQVNRITNVNNYKNQKNFEVISMNSDGSQPLSLDKRSQMVYQAVRGIEMTLDSVINYPEEETVRVVGSVYLGGQVVADNFGDPCTMSTGSEEPNTSKKYVLRETKMFQRDFARLLKDDDWRNDLHCVYQVLVKRPGGRTRKSRESGRQYEVFEYRIQSWGATKIMHEDGTIKFGKFAVKLYHPPIVLPLEDNGSHRRFGHADTVVRAKLTELQ
mmetsp:Transcript_53536/g.61363  ORF Transcript_53536/g.61363 Transcript_53536/m.61363 type:complete len:270 (+) Transcript_53536:2-811(+)